MEFIPILLFGILLVRDTDRFAKYLVKTKIIRYKDVLGILAMVIGVGIDLFYFLQVYY
jgi:hypothetical protein